MTTYLIVHPVAARPLGDGRFAIESAFGEHLRTLKELLEPEFTRIVLAGIRMTESNYLGRRGGLAVLEADEDDIGFVPLFDEGVSHLEFVTRQLPGALRTLTRLIGEAGCLHGSYSQDIVRPIEFPAMLLAWWRGLPTLAVVDVDHRRDPQMAWANGQMGTRKYLVERGLYEPIRRLQLHAMARWCSLLMVKEDSLVQDLADPSRDNVRFILDPGFESEHVIDEARLQAKRSTLGSRPLEVIYFGRLVPFKGVDRMLEAVAAAGARGGQLRFTIMGVGPSLDALRAQVSQLRLEETVRFAAPVPYGRAFFDRLYEADLLLAAPLMGDTPRSTWDAFASGQGILAFETPFYRSMAERTAAVTTVPWPNTEELGRRLHDLVGAPGEVATMQANAVAAAREHDQSSWLRRRIAWTRDLLEPSRQENVAPANPAR